MPLPVISILVVTLSAAVLIVLERSFPYESGQSLMRDGFVNDLALYTIVQSYVLSLVIFGVADWLDGVTGWSRSGLLRQWPVWSQVLLSVVGHDLYVYWFHRAQHRSIVLWRIHEAHHSTRDVDWLSGSRSHALEILINQTIEFVPLVLLGASPAAIAVKGIIDAVWGMYIHSNVNVKSGRLQYVINGPEMHRWHHAVDDEAHNRNFSTKLAIWDWIFGTAHLPRPRKPSAYGLTDARYPRGYVAQFLRGLGKGQASGD